MQDVQVNSVFRGLGCRDFGVQGSWGFGSMCSGFRFQGPRAQEMWAAVWAFSWGDGKETSTNEGFDSD